MNDATSTGFSAEDFETAAREAAAEAGRLLRRRFRETKKLAIEAKGLHDFVTEVDREAEAAIVGYIGSRFPDHAIMTEEGAPNAAAKAYRWVIDPLDGTTNFIHGVMPFCVSIALEDTEGLLAAAIHDPMHDETFHARRGGGAYLNDGRIRCSDPEGPGLALVATGFPFRELTRLDRYMVAFEAFVHSTAGIRRAGSAAIDLAYTACGRYDGFWEVGLSRWDIAAGTLLVQESGGIVSDVHGGRDHLDLGDIVAGGPAMHAMMLEVTKRAFGRQR